MLIKPLLVIPAVIALVANIDLSTRQYICKMIHFGRTDYSKPTESRLVRNAATIDMSYNITYITPIQSSIPLLSCTPALAKEAFRGQVAEAV